ncbi:MAG: segregation and condensation protein A [Gammaproteobacteria bacterium]|nr:segregation and condensation protein A [Gammaproteobacteria bacterium]
MTADNLSPEERILRMVKKVLTDVAKDTYTPPGLQHPLTENTILNIRECLMQITARERELAEAAGRPQQMRPHFTDEPSKHPKVVAIDVSGLKKKRPEEDTH